MKLRDIIAALESWAPPAYQEGYDNSGLIVGDSTANVNAALLTLDCTEAVVDEAIEKGVDLIIAHHPIVFSGLKRFNGSDYVQRTVMKAIRHGVAIYAIHTNLDNVYDGVNRYLGELIGVHNQRVLQPKGELFEKIVVFVPHSHAEQVRAALFAAGAGAIGDYDECSYATEGTGTFRANESANPFVGERGKRHSEPETRIEVIVPRHAATKAIAAALEAHPYEEVAFDRYPLTNTAARVGSGMIGDLPEAMSWQGLFDRLKHELKAQVIRHTQLPETSVKRVAYCGGSGFFLLQAAKRAGADVFITSDVKYHQFFDAEGIVLADVGHWESEHRTVELIARYLNGKFANFAVHFSQTQTNPVKYY
jgi:dinuclear metal center YbgI/SA1388 family protein